MPLRLTFLENILARFQMLPTPLFDMPLAAGVAKALVTACELGIFDTLDKRAFPLEELASSIGCDPQGLQLLLRLLVSSGYLYCKKGYYRNTRLARRWLIRSSPHCLTDFVLHAQDILEIWNHLPEVACSNRQVIAMPYTGKVETVEEQIRLQRHYRGLAALARVLGDEIIQKVRLPKTASRLLDVGGSHAVYSALLCRRYPHLQATILDLPPGLEAGHATANEMALDRRMNFVCADIVQDDFPSQFMASFDVAFYFHIAHLLQPSVNIVVLRKVCAALRPGGMLVFVDQVTDQTYRSHLASLIVQLMELTMRTTGGTCYSFVEVKGWLEQLGMVRIRPHRLLMPGVTLITALKA